MKIFIVFLIIFTVLIMGKSFFCAVEPAFSQFYYLQSKNIHLKQNSKATDSSFSKYWEKPLFIRKFGQFRHPFRQFEIWKELFDVILLFHRTKKQQTASFLFEHKTYQIFELMDPFRMGDRVG
jgi:hypothetical protein